MDFDELANRFDYHPPADQETVDRHHQVREAYAANVLATALPDGREKSLAMTKLEEAMMWGNAGIARSQHG